MDREHEHRAGRQQEALPYERRDHQTHRGSAWGGGGGGGGDILYKVAKGEPLSKHGAYRPQRPAGVLGTGRRGGGGGGRGYDCTEKYIAFKMLTISDDVLIFQAFPIICLGLPCQTLSYSL